MQRDCGDPRGGAVLASFPHPDVLGAQGPATLSRGLGLRGIHRPALPDVPPSDRPGVVRAYGGVCTSLLLTR